MNNNKNKSPIEIIQEVMDFINKGLAQEYEDEEYFEYNGGRDDYRLKNQSRALYILIEYFNEHPEIHKEGFKWFEPEDNEEEE